MNYNSIEFSNRNQLMDVGKIRSILTAHGRLTKSVEELENSSDLYQAGLTSLATVGLMLALEDEFDVEFPDSALSRKTFGSIETISDTLEDLLD
ncbi:MAG: acyl carrier protein [Kangiellaceae bacterium]|nr:acyl carrier protein [Kangiellaceae bacterium]